MTSLQMVGVLAHPKREPSAIVAARIAETLRTAGLQTWEHYVWKEEEIQDDLARADVVIAIGGDGAMLKAARVCAPFQVPVLGLNMGRLGFLTEAAPANWDTILPRLLAGDYWIERRMMVTAIVTRQGSILESGNALNDVVISGNVSGSMIQLDSYIDGHWATTYNSDALIISTPTGSTAYALAVGGPILPPDLANILILPAAAHLSMDRPIVLSEGSVVAVRPSIENRNQISVAIDGMQLASLQADDILYVRACDDYSLFIRMRERNYFYRSLLDRLEPRVNRSAPRRMKKIPNLTEPQT